MKNYITENPSTRRYCKILVTGKIINLRTSENIFKVLVTHNARLTNSNVVRRGLINENICFFYINDRIYSKEKIE